MTVATLDDLLSGPKPKAHKDLVLHGWREDRVGGRRHYVGRDERNRAVVGPVRHGKGLLNVFRKRKAKPFVEPPATERALKVIIDHRAVMEAARKAQQHDQQMQEGTRTVDFSKLTGTVTPPPPAPPQDGVVRRITKWCKEKFYDHEWQKAMQNTAGNVLLWSFTAFAVLTFAKGAWWLLSL